ncbi:CRISPR-associated endonuclease Cas1 [Metallosphaera hakonensis]|uniref:CRISPR-associated endonuclease Cas1 n=1 Tax=Metallosphaera hakonensis JCM 8857 = DSM 7519 TaxID=1293036 RepID=A0A2U9IWH0_9CREN|nr:CRISPR-associated endonuclease Cas1 [Metallosphaera hakonensis]AWS00431.1 CRISPR-associated endonuclease Cas1 [Metallosphaera hakonensis JCM 8857 = DSM 7519]
MDKKIAFVKDYGAYLRVKNGLIECSVKDQVKWKVSPAEIHSIVFLVTSSVSSEVIRLANEYGIDLVFFHRHEPYAKLIPARYGGSFRLWTRQMRSLRRGVEFARAFIYGKLHNQWVTLRYYEKKYGYDLGTGRLDELTRDSLLATSSEDVMGREAEAAKVYWRGVRFLLPTSLGFKGRRKKVSENLDAFNVALNVGYGMLRKVVWSAVVSVGLNPYVGFLHKFREGRPSLVFDLMEEFRSPFVDRPLIGLAREDSDKVSNLKEVYSLLSRIDEEEVYTQARKLANAVLSGEEYKPFMAK